MRNRILYISRNSVPYVKELNSLTNSILSTLLMQQLDYWFERHPDGFYKFLAPSPGHAFYKEGDSWLEELGMSKDEFRTAFNKIGIAYSSKSQYAEATDKFAGRFYCSYVDRKQNLTYYYRNHQLVDQKLDELVYRNQNAGPGPGTGEPRQVIDNKANGDSTSVVKRESRFTVNGDGQLTGNPQSQSTGNGEPRDQEIGKEHDGKSDLQLSGNGQSLGQGKSFPDLPTTEPTKEITKQQQQRSHQANETISNVGNGSSGDREEMYFPNNLAPEEKDGLTKLMAMCPAEHVQNVLDELEGIRANNGIKRGIMPLAMSLVSKATAGEFTPSLAITVAAQRNRRLLNEAMQRQQLELLPDGLAAEGQGREQFMSNMKAIGIARSQSRGTH